MDCKQHTFDQKLCSNVLIVVCNAQVKRTSAKTPVDSRISRRFFEGCFPAFFIVPLITTSKFRKGKSKFNKVNDLLPAQHSWLRDNKPNGRKSIACGWLHAAYAPNAVFNTDFLYENLITRHVMPQVKARADSLSTRIQ